MSFHSQLDHLLSCLSTKPKHTMDLIKCLDLTLLKADATEDELIQLKNKAMKHPVAAVCVYPKDLVFFDKANPYQVATVINFPTGEEEIANCLAFIQQAKQLGADEIDYVFPYQSFLSGEEQKALDHARAVSEYISSQGLTSKVIIETGAFENLDELYELASELIKFKFNFLKTSTGTTEKGADYAAAFTLATAIKETNAYTSGLKISGGVKTLEQANIYANIAETILEQPINNSWFRIGASSLLDVLITK